MRKYEFKVVPVPARCIREGNETGSPVAATLEAALNALGVEGWEFHRSETVSIKRAGLFSFGKKIEETVLVFRRDRVILEDRPSTEGTVSRRERKPRLDAEKKIAEPRRITVARVEGSKAA